MASPPWRIARALLIASRAEGNSAAVGADLARLAGAVGAGPIVPKFLAHPLIPVARKLDVLGQAVETGLVRSLLGALLGAGEAGLLPALARVYSVMQRRAAGEVEVVVSVPAPLAGDAERRLADAISRKTGRTARLHQRIDAGLIGGVRVRIDGRVLDDSLSGRLAELEKKALAS